LASEQQEASMSCSIHPTAVIDKSAEIGEGTEIGAYCVVGPKVKIGDRCKLYSHVVVESYTELGPECEIFQFASIGAKPQDLKFKNEPSLLIIGAHNVIRECVTLHRGTEHGNMKTVIGDNNMFMANSHVAHDCIIGNRNVFANCVGLAGHVTIYDNVNLGGLVGIHQFCRIGSYAFLSAGSMIGHDVPPYCIAQGDRCFLRGLNLIGLQRAGFTPEQIVDLKRTYRQLFMRGIGHMSKRIPELPQELSSQPHVKALLDFITGTQRGVMSTSRDRSTGDDE